MSPCDGPSAGTSSPAAYHLQDQTRTEAAPTRSGDSSASPSIPSSSSSFTSHPAREPSKPRTPKPWLWRCHACNATFRLSCGRRCLRCGHFMCTRRLLPWERREDVCGTEFDYRRWAAWGHWRREKGKKRNRDGDKGTEGDEQQRKKRMSGRGELSTCWMDCDYPSECRHTRAEMRMQDGVEGDEDEFDGRSSLMVDGRHVLNMSADDAENMFEADYLKGRFGRGEDDLDTYPPTMDVEYDDGEPEQ